MPWLPRIAAFLLTPLACASIALAQPAPGAYLKWDQALGAGGLEDRSFACGENTGTDELVGSFVPDADVSSVVGFVATLEVRSLRLVLDHIQPPLPEWWRMQPGGCRANSFTTSADFTGEPFVSATGVEDFLGNPALVLARHVWPFQPERGLPYGLDSSVAQVTIEVTLPIDQATILLAGHEYYAFRGRLSHAHTTGIPACGGCCTAIGVRLLQIQLVQDPQPASPVFLWGGPNEGNLATWQRYNETACLMTVPAATSTWGAMKTRYR